MISDYNEGSKALPEREEKPPYHHGDLHAALIRAVLEQVRQAGPEGVSLRAAARASGVSPAATFRHFADKRAVMTAIAAEGFAAMAARMEAEAERATTDLERFGAVGRGYLAFALESPAHFRVMFRTDLIDEADPALRASGDAVRAALSGGLTRILPGGVDEAEARRRALLAWAAVHGVATLWIEGALDERMAPGGPPDLLRALGGMLPVFTAPPEGGPTSRPGPAP